MQMVNKKAAKQANDEAAVLAAIAAMPDPYCAIGEHLHAIIKECAPNLLARTWYGMPAYSNKDGKVICFFRGADKFRERYMTLGFNDSATLDDGVFWPIAFALTELNPETEAAIRTLVKKSVR